MNFSFQGTLLIIHITNGRKGREIIVNYSHEYTHIMKGNEMWSFLIREISTTIRGNDH